MLLRRVATSSQATIQRRGLLRPPINLPFKGVYRRDGDEARKDDLLVTQRRLNYHPGANVRAFLAIFMLIVYFNI